MSFPALSFPTLPPRAPARRPVPALLAVVLALAVLVPAVAPAGAITFRSGSEVIIPAGEVVEDDIYLNGDRVVIEGVVTGDVVAAGSEVILRGSISGDLLAAGRLIHIDGRVGDDVRAAGVDLWIGPGASVEDDVLASVVSVEMEPGATIGGSAMLTAVQILVSGTIEEQLRATAAAVELTGTTRGDVSVLASGDLPGFMTFLPKERNWPEIDPGFEMGPEARIEGALNYTTADEARIDPGATILGSTTSARLGDDDEGPGWTGRLLEALGRFLALLLVGLLFLWLAPTFTRGLADTVARRPLGSLGWGVVALLAALLALLLVPLAAAALALALGFVTLGTLVPILIGLALVAEGLLFTGLWASLSFLAPVVVALALGGLVLRRGASEGTRLARLAPLLVAGLVLLVLIGLVPFLGALVGVLVALTGLGAWWLRIFGRKGTTPEDETETGGESPSGASSSGASSSAASSPTPPAPAGEETEPESSDGAAREGDTRSDPGS